MKRIPRFDHILLFSIAALALSACGGGVNGTGTKKAAIDALIAEERNLIEEERAIATRICYAYQSKNTSFRTQSYMGGTFRFGIISKSCEGTSENYNISAVLQLEAGGRLTYVPSLTNTRSFERQVQTNGVGYLAQLCTKIQTNQPVSNTVNIDGFKVQIQFFKENLDGFILRYFQRFSNMYKIERAETFKVRTQFNSSSGQILGMDEIFSRERVCQGNDGVFSKFTQTFSNFSL
jgi:hypothetical protein